MEKGVPFRYRFFRKGKTNGKTPRSATMKHTEPEDGSAHLSTRTRQPTLTKCISCSGRIALGAPERTIGRTSNKTRVFPQQRAALYRLVLRFSRKDLQ